MIPKLIREYISLNGCSVCFLSTGVISTSFEIEHIDFEKVDPSQVSRDLERFLHQIPEGVTVKFHSSSERVFDDVAPSCKRNDAIKEIGWTKHRLVLLFEKKVPSFKNLLSRLLRKGVKDTFMDEYFEDFVSSLNINSFSSFGFKATAVRCNIRFGESAISHSNGSLRIDNSYLSVVKLHKLGNYESSLANLCLIREALSDPYEIVFSVKRVDEKETQYLLNNKSKREESGGDLKSHKKFMEAQRALEEIDNHGKKVFCIEFTVFLWFPTDQSIHQHAFDAKSMLSQIGDFGVEDMGLISAFVAGLPGGLSHISNIEMTDRVPSFFPILIRGRQSVDKVSERSFLFHRQDDTVDHLDPFDPSYTNFSVLFVGTSGKGKSVCANNLQQSLYNDPKLKIILVDVKGSHTNTVRNLNGSIHKIGTSSNTAISPFNFIRDNKSKEVVEIISDFLEKLLTESHETHLLRTEQATLEDCLLKYIRLNPSNPSIDDFIKKISNIPRVDSLKRWQKGGVYGSVFSDYSQPNESSRIQYFDFTNIVTAQKGGVGPAVMSAIMAHFNYQLISKKIDEKLVFIADETPFFIESCFSSFNLLMKNVRKLNGSLILIAQNLSDLVVNGDASLINQAELRVFFSRDKGSKDFRDLSGLSASAIETLEDNELSTINGKFAQFIIKDPHCERIGKLRLSKEEYYRSTTLADDRYKIEQITELFQFRDENQAIEILADIGSRYEIIG